MHILLLFHVLSISRRVTVLNTKATENDLKTLKREANQEVGYLQELRPDLEKKKASSVPEFHAIYFQQSGILKTNK